MVLDRIEIKKVILEKLLAEYLIAESSQTKLWPLFGPFVPIIDEFDQFYIFVVVLLVLGLLASHVVVIGDGVMTMSGPISSRGI